jgi:hypothetical protein
MCLIVVESRCSHSALVVINVVGTFQVGTPHFFRTFHRSGTSIRIGTIYQKLKARNEKKQWQKVNFSWL